MQPVLRLKRGRDRARFHPWIFKGDVADVADVPPGTAVTIVDSGGRFVGRGFFNPRPALCCRILTREDESIDGEFFRHRLATALAHRARIAHAESPARSTGARLSPRADDMAQTYRSIALGRLVWSEADGLPGLVVDRYGSVLVVQCLTLGMARARAEIVEALGSLLGPMPVFAADDTVTAPLEGFEPQRAWIGDRSGPDTVIVQEDDVRLQIVLGAGHKTGLYLDQSRNRRRVGALARGRTVLDAFAYTGGFAAHALVRGAKSALCLESSPDAIAGARTNLALNGVAGRAEVRPTNVFDELRALERAGTRFGLVVLDPPPFARSRQALEAAARGYKEINLRAMRLLERGGLLATFSCSHHVSEAFFVERCREAAVDAGVTLRVLETLTQSPDHPVLLTVPETRYLKGLLLEAV